MQAEVAAERMATSVCDIHKSKLLVYRLCRRLTRCDGDFRARQCSTWVQLAFLRQHIIERPNVIALYHSYAISGVVDRLLSGSWTQSLIPRRQHRPNAQLHNAVNAYLTYHMRCMDVIHESSGRRTPSADALAVHTQQLHTRRSCVQAREILRLRIVFTRKHLPILAKTVL